MDLINCPNCNAQNDPGDAFCMNCGESLEGYDPDTGVRNCPSCNAQVDAGADFCNNCGTDLSGVDSDDSGGILGTLLKVGGVLVLAFIVLGVLGAAIGGPDTGDGAGDADGGAGAATQTPSSAHAMGETFVVGSGDQAIEYEITRAYTTPVVGPSAIPEEADGIFVVVQLELTNVGDESFRVTDRVFTLVGGQDREFDPDTEAQITHEDSLALGEQLNPGVSNQGVVIFDVPEEQTERSLRIEPAGFMSGAEEHTVDIEVERPN